MPLAPPVLARIVDDEEALASLGSVTTVVSVLRRCQLIFASSSPRVPDSELSRDTD